MRNEEKKGLLILIGVAILIISVIWLFTRNKSNEDKQPINDPSSTTTSIASEDSASQGEFTKVEENGTIVNTSEKLNGSKEELGYSLTDITFGEVNGETVLKARVTNKTESAQSEFLGNIVLLDQSGNEIGRIPVNISETQPGETIEIEAYITESYANAYDFKLEK